MINNPSEDNLEIAISEKIRDFRNIDRPGNKVGNDRRPKWVLSQHVEIVAQIGYYVPCHNLIFL